MFAFIAVGAVAYSRLEPSASQLLLGPELSDAEQLVIAPAIWGAIAGAIAGGLLIAVAILQTLWKHARLPRKPGSCADLVPFSVTRADIVVPCWAGTHGTWEPAGAQLQGVLRAGSGCNCT